MKKRKTTMRDHMKERLGGKPDFLSLEPPLPRSINIEVNNTCNQRCVFCPYHGRYTLSEMKPAVLEVKFVKELMFQAHSLGMGEKEIGFYLAGEAFLYKDLVELIAYAKELGFEYVFLTTNGALANHKRMQEIIDAGIDSIRFSVNAPDKERYKEIHGKDDFDTVLDNIQYMRVYLDEKNIDIATSISCVITRRTQGIENDMRRVFGKYVDDIMFIPVMLNRLSNIEEVKKLYEVIDDSDSKVDKSFVCPLLFNTMYINAFGRVVPCCDAYDNGTYFADLNKNSDLRAAWNSNGYKRFRKIFLEDASDEGTICETCMLRRKTVTRFTYDE